MAKENQYIPSIVFHPGETLGEKLEELKMGPKEFALRSGKPEKTIIAILHGKSAITTDMAVQFENVTKIPANFWMNHQRSFDEFQARLKRQAVIEAATGWAKQFPLSDMTTKGWLPERFTIEEKTMELLAFFGFSNHNAWEEYYFNQQLKVAFRISLAQTKEPFAISAWLRRGELQAANLNANKFSEKKFKAALQKLKSISSNPLKNSFQFVQTNCLEAGVKVIYTPCIANVPIDGATRWLNDTPLIQLSDQNHLIDHFWFTFFHAAAHILLHGKKEVFLENLDYADKNMGKEQEADQFARKWMMLEDEESELIASAFSHKKK